MKSDSEGTARRRLKEQIRATVPSAQGRGKGFGAAKRVLKLALLSKRGEEKPNADNKWQIQVEWASLSTSLSLPICGGFKIFILQRSGTD